MASCGATKPTRSTCGGDPLPIAVRLQHLRARGAAPGEDGAEQPVKGRQVLAVELQEEFVRPEGDEGVEQLAEEVRRRGHGERTVRPAGLWRDDELVPEADLVSRASV